MKKFLFLLLVLAAAVYFGISTGDDITSSVAKPADHTLSREVKPEKKASSDAGVLATVKDGVSTFISGFSSTPTKEGSVETTPAPAPKDSGKSTVAAEQKVETAKEEIGDITHFHDALESRVHRENFVPIDQIPDNLKHGIVATEDRRFYEHGAIDLIGVARAAFTNYMAGETVEGGSTIAQQTVKNIFLSSDRTMERKVKEMILAVQLERQYSKDQILELYLNTIYFGHGAYGVKEAAKTYFGKEAKDLDLSQCAMLAGLPQAPSAYDPLSHPQEGAKRMTVVLALMAEQGYITPQDAAKAAADLWIK